MPIHNRHLNNISIGSTERFCRVSMLFIYEYKHGFIKYFNSKYDFSKTFWNSDFPKQRDSFKCIRSIVKKTRKVCKSWWNAFFRPQNYRNYWQIENVSTLDYTFSLVLFPRRSHSRVSICLFFLFTTLFNRSTSSHFFSVSWVSMLYIRFAIESEGFASSVSQSLVTVRNGMEKPLSVFRVSHWENKWKCVR